MRMSRALYALAISLLFCHFLSAQNLGTGLYKFGSFDSRGFDSINLGNLNTHFEIPIINKQGRGLNFSYAIVYDGLVWSPTNSVWQPDAGWGFHGQLLGGGYTGYLTYTQLTKSCPVAGVSHPPPGLTLTNYVYHDPYGKNHHFNYQISSCPETNEVITGNGSTSDSSGLSYGGPSHIDGLIHASNGSIINAPVGTGAGTGNITDPNGNVVTNNGNGTFTDTLGVTALTIGGSGTPTSPTTLTYPVTHQSSSSITSATVTIAYTNYTVQTNFQCSGITEYPATSVNLVDHITLPDAAASTYSFTYEATLGGVSGAVTGRLKSITLPTGGTITYAYSGGCSAAAGMNADGSTGGLNRVTADGTKTYTRTTVNANATNTKVQDEKGNQALYQFTIFNSLYYETHRQIYQSTIGGTPLLDQSTCYNGATSSCDGAAISATQITQNATLTSYNGGSSKLGVNNVYDASGMLTSSTQMSGSTVLESIHNSYNTLEELTASTTTDSSGNTVASSTFNYDETTPTATSGIPQHGAASGIRGNQTSAQITTGSGTLNAKTTYYDTGVPIATTTPNGATAYSYDSTQTFVTTTTLPTPSSGVSLATTASYDQPSGALLSITGMNPGQTTQVTQYDPLLRPVIVTMPNGGTSTYTYVSASEFYLTQPMGNGQNAVTYTLNDTYGRLSRIAVYNGQSTNGWYQVDYCYDAAGYLNFQSNRYQSTGFSAPKQCSSSGTSYLYDALGRLASSTNSDGSTTYQYFGRAVLTTDVNNVQKVTQYDLLGRISAICEISSSAGSSACSGTEIGGTGFLTNYSYTLSPASTTILQGAQQRIFKTDQVGRTTSVTEPERGTTNYTYAYNTTGLVVTRTRPKANQSVVTALTTTTTQYDSLGRVVSITYDDGLTPTKTFFYDASAGWTETQSNLKGLLSQISATTSDGKDATIYSYDLMGWPAFDISCTPSRCGASVADHGNPYTHDLVGNILSMSDAAGPIYTYTYSPAGEVSSITSSQSDSTHPPNLVSGVQNGVNGPVSYTLGNGLNVASTYDSIGRLSGSWLCKNSSQTNCSGGTQIYGFTVTQTGDRTVGSCDTVLNRCSTWGYDDFDRLAQQSVSQGTLQNFTYVYDRYGNRTQQNVTQGSGPAPIVSFDATTNRINSSGYGYDAAGNLTSDGFHSYTYDAEGDILQVDGGATAKYAYDALNHRIREDVGSKLTEFVYNSAGQRISYWNATNTALIQGQVYWGNKPVAFREGGERFQHQDYLGTERMTTNWTGTVDGTFVSLPFGDGYTTSGSDYDQYHFAQLDHDNESVTDHAQFRQYSPTQGRWMSPDPYDGSYDATNPQSLNRYSYALNSPLSFVDPRGRCLTTNVLDDDGNVIQTVVTGTDCPGGDNGSGFDWYLSEYGGPGCGFTAPGMPSQPCQTVVGGGSIGSSVKSTQTQTSPAPSNSGPNPCSVYGRAQMLGSGLLNLTLAAGKFTAAAGVEAGTSGVGTALALYGVYSGAGNLTTGLIQTIGAFSSMPSQFQQAANVSSTVGSIAGLTTLVVTNGNLSSASNAAKWENLGLFGLKGGMGSSFNPVSATGTAVNGAKLAGAHIGC
jgi:RHS repeat-associated protein